MAYCRRVRAVLLGGGFPEVFARELAANEVMHGALRAAAARGVPIYGECGGLMYLGRALTDAEGVRHAMAGLLPCASTMQGTRLTLGYREAESCGTPLLPAGERVRGHEFHWSALIDAPDPARTGSSIRPVARRACAPGASPGRTCHAPRGAARPRVEPRGGGADGARVSAPLLMVVGTASSVGKSVLVTALCRIFRQDGVRVAPFKAQNMSNNADVTPDGLEIGRAQSEQAAAAGLAPRVEMNPVLLKPQGDRTSQVVLNGRPAGLLTSAGFDRRGEWWPHVTRALDVLRDEYALVVAEGAGSPAEPNLYARDIVNMSVARYAQATTLLVGDIDRGGVFAHFVGTLALLPPEDRALVRGLVINRFRGDPALLDDAVRDVEGRTGVPVLGVIPWIDGLGVAQEDAVALERTGSATAASGDSLDTFDIAVVQLPRIANFDDFDPLAAEPGVRVRYVDRAEALGTPALIVIPGTKATIADLDWLRARGLDVAIRARIEAGGSIIGICGGMQMLGERLLDPDGVEAAAGTVTSGLGLLPLATTFVAEKTTRRVAGHVAAGRGHWASLRGYAVQGYEIHMGRTTATRGATSGATPSALDPLLRLDGHEGLHDDGAVSLDGRVAGTYLHGLFANDAFRRTLLRSLGWRGEGAARAGERTAERRDREFDRLAGVVRAHLDLPRIRTLLGLPESG